MNTNDTILYTKLSECDTRYKKILKDINLTAYYKNKQLVYDFLHAIQDKIKNDLPYISVDYDGSIKCTWRNKFNYTSITIKFPCGESLINLLFCNDKNEYINETSCHIKSAIKEFLTHIYFFKN
jgi:hypothetical protein